MRILRKKEINDSMKELQASLNNKAIMRPSELVAWVSLRICCFQIIF